MSGTSTARAIGQRREELVTPALVLDIDAAQRNIDHMASELEADGRGHDPAALQDAQEPGPGPPPAGRPARAGCPWPPCGRPRCSPRPGWTTCSWSTRWPIRPSSGCWPNWPGITGYWSRWTRRERRGPVRGRRHGGVDARDHDRGRHRHGPLRGGQRRGRPGGGPAGDRTAGAALRGHHRLRGSLLADAGPRLAARAPARGDDVLHRRRRRCWKRTAYPARSGRRAGSRPGTGPRPSRA